MTPMRPQRKIPFHLLLLCSPIMFITFMLVVFDSLRSKGSFHPMLQIKTIIQFIPVHTPLWTIHSFPRTSYITFMPFILFMSWLSETTTDPVWGPRRVTRGVPLWCTAYTPRLLSSLLDVILRSSSGASTLPPHAATVNDTACHWGKGGSVAPMNETIVRRTMMCLLKIL